MSLRKHSPVRRRSPDVEPFPAANLDALRRGPQDEKGAALAHAVPSVREVMANPEWARSLELAKAADQSLKPRRGVVM